MNPFELVISVIHLVAMVAVVLVFPALIIARARRQKRVDLFGGIGIFLWAWNALWLGALLWEVTT